MAPVRRWAGGLVGRDHELDTAASLIAGGVRLLTFTGPPGVGKTRLAFALAERCAPLFPGGPLQVDLSGAESDAGALDQLDRVFGHVAGPVGPARGGRRPLPDGATLLLLDDADHALGIGERLLSLLADRPRLQILVTSRERMRLELEQELPVPPLAMPAVGEAVDPARLAQVPSAALFVAAAREVQPDFAVTADNAAAVAEICVRLDGLPLALLLAAARVRLFSPRDIALRLGDRKAVLEATARDVQARHRSLAAAISWSYDVLSGPERTLLRRLAIFAAPFTLAEAARVCAPPGVDVEATLASLLDKSLVQRVALDSAEARFSLLESIHDFAAGHLARDDDRGPLEDRHTALLVDGARAIEAALGTPAEPRHSDWVRHHEADLRAARLRCASRGELEAELVLTTALAWGWYTHGRVGSGRRLVEESLSRLSDPPHPAADHAAVARGVVLAAQIAGGVLAWADTDLERAEQLVAAAYEASEREGDDRHVAIASAFLGHVARERGSHAAARIAHERAATVFDALGSAQGSAWARFDLGRTAWEAGRPREARALLRDALSRFRRLGYPWAVAWTAWALGTLLVEEGASERDVRDGIALVGTAVTEFEQSGDLRGCCLCWESLAAVASARGRAAEAVRLVGAATAVRDRLAAPRYAAERHRVEAALAAAHAELGEYRADLERRSGLLLDSNGACALARDIVSGWGPPDEAAPPALLTERERDVAALVAQGCTNQQIAHRLTISARTAETHVHHIMAKLGARSRAEVAVWAVSVLRQHDG